jgi:hypothetical protein
MCRNDELISLAQDLRIYQDELRKAKLDRQSLDDVSNLSITFDFVIEHEKQKLDVRIEWLEKLVEYMRRRLKNARKRAIERY